MAHQQIIRHSVPQKMKFTFITVNVTKKSLQKTKYADNIYW